MVSPCMWSASRKIASLIKQWMVVKIPWILMNAMIGSRKPSSVLRKSCRAKLVHPITSMPRKIPRSVLSSITQLKRFSASVAHLSHFHLISPICATLAGAPPLQYADEWCRCGCLRFRHGWRLSLSLSHSLTKIINHDI